MTSREKVSKGAERPASIRWGHCWKSRGYRDARRTSVSPKFKSLHLITFCPSVKVVMPCLACAKTI